MLFLDAVGRDVFLGFGGMRNGALSLSLCVNYIVRGMSSIFSFDNYYPFLLALFRLCMSATGFISWRECCDFGILNFWFSLTMLMIVAKTSLFSA